MGDTAVGGENVEVIQTSGWDTTRPASRYGYSGDRFLLAPGLSRTP